VQIDFLFGDDSPTSTKLPSPVGRGIATSDEGLLVYIQGYSSRNTRNSVSFFDLEGDIEELYAGFYDSILWSAQKTVSDYAVLITEQEYRALYHPPFLRLISNSSGLEGDYPTDGEPWMADRAFAFYNDTILLRRLTRADWPDPMDQSRSEIVRVKREAFK